MRTVKVVILGNSGIGKTSLRGWVRTVNCLFVRGSLSESSLPQSMSLANSRQSTVLQIWIRHHHYPLRLHSLVPPSLTRP
jgi:hypothetical protein